MINVIIYRSNFFIINIYKKIQMSFIMIGISGMYHLIIKKNTSSGSYYKK